MRKKAQSVLTLMILCLLVGLLAKLCFADFPHDNTNKSQWWSGGPFDNATAWARNIDHAVAGPMGTGETFYVDSGASGAATGEDWTDACATLDAAVGLCTASRGDRIYVAQGHNETLDAADDVDIDVAGVTVIGCGTGTLMPTFDFDAATAGMFAIGAANVTIVNLRFRCSTNGIAGIDVESAADQYRIINCSFGWAETATDEFANAIIVGDTANYGVIKGCEFRAGGQAAVSAIKLDADVVGCEITENKMWGDYSTAVIVIDEASDDIIITNNMLFNGTMGGDGEINTLEVLQAADSTAGFVADNRIVSDVATGLLMRVADDMTFMNNYISDTDGDEFSGTTEDTAASITAHADG